MRKFWMALGALGLVLVVMLGTEEKTKEQLYPTTGVVTYISYGEDIVIFEDFSGNQWSFFGTEDWMVGDIVSCVMDGHFTESIKDDTIVKVQYSGYFEKGN